MGLYWSGTTPESLHQFPKANIHSWDANGTTPQSDAFLSYWSTPNMLPFNIYTRDKHVSFFISCYSSFRRFHGKIDHIANDEDAVSSLLVVGSWLRKGEYLGGDPWLSGVFRSERDWPFWRRLWRGGRLCWSILFIFCLWDGCGQTLPRW